jgi:hypothetical protein
MYRNTAENIFINNLKMQSYGIVYTTGIMSCQTMQHLRQEYESNPTIIENLSPEMLAIREFVKNQTLNTFGMPIADYILHSIVNGFILFIQSILLFFS